MKAKRFSEEQIVGVLEGGGDRGQDEGKVQPFPGVSSGKRRNSLM